MPIDIEAAERFILANARLLDRHRLAPRRQDRLSPDVQRVVADRLRATLR